MKTKKKEKLLFYGTGDEAFETFMRGVEFLQEIEGGIRSKTIAKNLRSWLRMTAKLSKRNYAIWYGDPNDPNCDKTEIEI